MISDASLWNRRLPSPTPFLSFSVPVVSVGANAKEEIYCWSPKIPERQIRRDLASSCGYKEVLLWITQDCSLLLYRTAPASNFPKSLLAGHHNIIIILSASMQLFAHLLAAMLAIGSRATPLISALETRNTTQVHIPCGCWNECTVTELASGRNDGNICPNTCGECWNMSSTTREKLI
jgi:hypothetical protein